MNSLNTVNERSSLFFQYSRRDLIPFNMSARMHNFLDVPFSLTIFFTFVINSILKPKLIACTYQNENVLSNTLRSTTLGLDSNFLTQT